MDFGPRMGMGSGPSQCESNTVLAAVPYLHSGGFDYAKQAFTKYGDIQSMERVPGPSPAVCVAYYDVRSAQRAMEALGHPHCLPGPPKGDRCVRLSGEYNLSPEDCSAEVLAGLRRSSHDDEKETYEVLFYDIRVAERVRSASESSEKLKDDFLEPPPGLEHLARPPGLQPKQKKQVSNASTGLKDVTNMPPVLRSANHVLLVEGLPNMLCSYNMLEATLQQAGFQDSVNKFTTRPGKPCGEAKLWLSTMEAAQNLMNHFQNRRWDKSGRPVVCKLDNNTILDDSNPTCRKRCDTGATMSTDVGGPSDGEEEPSVGE